MMAARMVLLRRIELPIDGPLEDFRAYLQLLKLLERTPRLAGHIRAIHVRDWPGISAGEIAPLIAAALGLTDLRLVAPVPFVHGVLTQIAVLSPLIVRLALVLDHVNAMASLTWPLTTTLMTVAGTLEVLELRAPQGTGLELPEALYLPRVRVLHTQTIEDTARRLINASPQLVDLELNVYAALPFVDRIDETIARHVRRITIRSSAAFMPREAARTVTRMFESVTAIDFGQGLDVPNFDYAPLLETLVVERQGAVGIMSALGRLTMPIRLREVTLRGNSGGDSPDTERAISELQALGKRLKFAVEFAGERRVHELTTER